MSMEGKRSFATLLLNPFHDFLQEKRNGFDHLPPILFEPALVGYLIQFFDPLKLVVSLGIIFVRSADLVRDDGHAALFQHLHQHGRAGAWQA